jgi:GDP-L-fucose synthase
VELQGATVVVTGGTGFLGRHVCEELATAGAKVEPVGRARYDLRHRAEIEQMLSDTRPNAVVHLAAVVGGIGANRAHPGQFLYENAIMGLELLDACRVAGVAKTVVAGTETNAPYGLAKKLLLTQCQAYRSEYGMHAIYLLPVNLYGPGDNFDLETSHVIPAMIRRFVEARENRSESVTLWGDGSPTREFLYVDDAARAFRLALERYDGADPINIGSGDEISIARLATLLANKTEYRGEIVWNRSRPNGQPRRTLDTSKATEFLNFSTRVSLSDGIARTAEWYEDSRR